MPRLRKNKPTAKIDLTISLLFHGLIIALLAFFAARQGYLGKQLKQFAVVIVPKEKTPKPPEKPPEQPKPVVKEVKPAAPRPKPTAVPTPRPAATPPPADTSSDQALAAAAPASAITADFRFNDGAVAVQTTSDPIALYQSSVENTLKSRWMRPDDIDDSRFVVEVQVSVDNTGQLSTGQWLHVSGNKDWDDSVRRVFARVKTLSRPPPPGFPPSFKVKFDVQEVPEPLALN